MQRYLKTPGGAIALGGSASQSRNYQRPADWLTLPEVSPTEQRFVGLHAVYENSSNFVAFTVAGACTVKWGDGNVEDFAAGTVASHHYAWDDIPASTLSSRGYRQVLISITPQAGNNLTSIDLSTTYPGIAVSYATKWLDIVVAGNYISNFTTSGAQNARMLERFEQVGTWSVTNFYRLFYNCSSLVCVASLDSVGVTSFFSMCGGCSSLRIFPDLDYSSGAVFIAAFANCYCLPQLTIADAAAAGSMSSAFSGCLSLVKLVIGNAGNITNFSNALNNCPSISQLQLDGLTCSFSAINSMMGRAELAVLLNSLGPARTDATAAITGNYGIVDLTDTDRAPAVNGGWIIAE